MARSLRVLPWLALAVLGGMAAFPRGASAQEPETPHLRVQGQGVVSVRPDLAIVTIGAVARRDTAQEAFDQANTLVGSLNQFLRSQGVPERDVATRQFSLSPEFSRPQGDAQPQIIGWRATNLLAVKIRDFSTIGSIVDGSVRILGNDAQLSGISFTVEDTDAVARQARDQAIANARQRAEQLATAAGVRLIRILSINETSAPLPAPIAERAVAAAAPAAPDISPGEQRIVVSVEVVYEIG
jgi:uncharacterized protein YggE